MKFITIMRKRKPLTWKDLADKIGKMTEDQQNQIIRVWGEDRPLSDGAWLDIEPEDMCWDPDYPDDGCSVRSDWVEQESLVVTLKANTYFLTAL